MFPCNAGRLGFEVPKRKQSSHTILLLSVKGTAWCTAVKPSITPNPVPPPIDVCIVYVVAVLGPE